MRPKTINYVLIKAFIFLLLYTMMHFAYEIIPLPIFAASESVWEHLKIGLFAALLIGLIEIVIFTMKGRVIFLQNLMFSRIISSLLVPLIIFLLFYLSIALFGKISLTVVEISINVAITFLSGFLAFYIENALLDYPVYERPVVLWIFIVLLIITIYLFIKFTSQKPYYPLFVER